MHPNLTRDEFVQLVHRYYPTNIEAEDPRYMESEEAQRLNALLQTHQEPLPAWTGFIQCLHKEFPTCSIWDTTVPHADPCYSCRVSLPGFVTGALLYNCVVCLISQLAPVYALYASHVDRAKQPERDYWLRFPPFPPEFQAHEAKLAVLIESIFGTRSRDWLVEERGRRRGGEQPGVDMTGEVVQ